ncbi:MAG: NfeD family protein [Pseudodonghicola sp.]|uniref:NfeD family protein n=1 Tax=Pseudodonghicola sp. TaxID=1969463 RepID=UPI003A97533D
MLLWTIWWLWIAAALVLATLEVLVPGFVFLGFAFGALGVGLLLLLIGAALTLAPLLLIFALLSLAAWVVMRRLFPHSSGQTRIIDKDIND